MFFEKVNPTIFNGDEMLLDKRINNDIYNILGDRWYTAQDDPIALLRAESKLKIPWIDEQISNEFTYNKFNLSLLDIGCGGGIVSNQLARLGYQVTGVDLSRESLEIASKYDTTKTAVYLEANAYDLPFDNDSLDIVTCLDTLEHVDNPSRLVQEAHRVLKPGGLFFYHTFNRNFISWLIIIKVVEWFIKNTPANLHIYKLFIKPVELISICEKLGFRNCKITGMRPSLKLRYFFDIFKGVVPSDFKFEYTDSLRLSYMGYLKKQ